MIEHVRAHAAQREHRDARTLNQRSEALPAERVGLRMRARRQDRGQGHKVHRHPGGLLQLLSAMAGRGHQHRLRHGPRPQRHQCIAAQVHAIAAGLAGHVDRAIEHQNRPKLAAQIPRPLRDRQVLARVQPLCAKLKQADTRPKRVGQFSEERLKIWRAGRLGRDLVEIRKRNASHAVSVPHG
uniref:Uncharacterized protein n=1 Tax=Ralstonia solanacearum TaxID=305 RepID=A0A0S4WHN1_RALSL|nr:protein of unknown function [Ralstonia solanacearum]